MGQNHESKVVLNDDNQVLAAWVSLESLKRAVHEKRHKLSGNWFTRRNVMFLVAETMEQIEDDYGYHAFESLINGKTINDVIAGAGGISINAAIRPLIIEGATLHLEEHPSDMSHVANLRYSLGQVGRIPV